MTLEEEKNQLRNFWRNIYKKHENLTKEKWNTEVKEDYKQEILEGNILQVAKYQNIPPEIKEHMDLAVNTDEILTYEKRIKEHLDMEFKLQTHIKPMMDTVIDTNKITKTIKSMKKGKSAGPDGLKIELYKEMLESEVCLQKLTECLQTEYYKGTKPVSWKTSKTKMIPKTSKPTAKDLRPITLTDVSYKIFMALIRDDIENHLVQNNLVKETQAGFTKGSRIEDNLFTLQYCVEDTYQRKKSLFVISIDCKKAFDSIDRGTMIEVMKKYKIYSSVIDIIAEIYDGDQTEICLRDEIKEIMEVTSGISQGCTGSTILFKLIAYIIMEKIEKENKGFKNDLFMLSSLFFADDGLIMTETTATAKEIIRLVTDISRECGLELNKDKSKILIFNMKNQPEELEGIEVTEHIKYLGVTIDNKRKLFKTHKRLIEEKAQRMANMTYSVTEKSVNKILIGKTYWKSVVLPSLLHAANVINFTKTEIKKLQTIENDVYRRILGASRYTPVCTLRGEIGASAMRTRIAKGRILYWKSIKDRRNDLLKEILLDMKERKFGWVLETEEYAKEMNANIGELTRDSKDLVKKKIQKIDELKWNEERQGKSSLEIYNAQKTKIAEVAEYDNTFSSVLWFQARTNTMPLNDRKRHSNESTKCDLCDSPKEDLQHFILNCIKLSDA